MKSCGHDAGGRRRGFTLIELMVVIVIIAILTALILPEMKGTYDDALLRSTARKLADAFAIANSRAITANRQHEVRIDTARGRYAVEPKRAGDSILSSAASDFPGSHGEFDTRISVHLITRKDSSDQPEATEPGSTKEDRVSFYPDGTADSMDVVLKDRAGFGMVLRVSPVTARVQVLELERR